MSQTELSNTLNNKLNYNCYPYIDEGFVIHMLTSSERTFYTNAYIIETDNALVVVDTLMINSDALLLRQHIEKIDKPLIAIIITHGHPDHYNGTEVISNNPNNVPIISTKGVRDCIQNTFDSKEAKWRPYFGKDWPEHKILPNQIVADGDIIDLDGLHYSFRDLGAAESSSDLFFTVGKNKSAVFVGDVVFNKMHGFMNDGNTTQWLQVLKQLSNELINVKDLYTGHGSPGNTSELIQNQMEYISQYRACIKMTTNANIDSNISHAQKKLIEKNLIALYPNYQLVSFIQAGIEAVYQELNVKA